MLTQKSKKITLAAYSRFYILRNLKTFLKDIFDEDTVRKTLTFLG